MNNELNPALPASDYKWEFWNGRDVEFHYPREGYEKPKCVRCNCNTWKMHLLDHDCTLGKNKDLIWMCTSCKMDFRKEELKKFTFEFKITMTVEHSSRENAIEWAKHEINKSWLTMSEKPQLLRGWRVY